MERRCSFGLATSTAVSATLLDTTSTSSTVVVVARRLEQEWQTTSVLSTRVRAIFRNDRASAAVCVRTQFSLSSTLYEQFDLAHVAPGTRTEIENRKMYSKHKGHAHMEHLTAPPNKKNVLLWPE